MEYTVVEWRTIIAGEINSTPFLVAREKVPWELMNHRKPTQTQIDAFTKSLKEDKFPPESKMEQIVSRLRAERKAAIAEIQRLIDDGWKLEGSPVKLGSDVIKDVGIIERDTVVARTVYMGDVYGQALTRQRPVAIIPPVPPTLIPVAPSVPEPATLVPPAVNWNRLNARSRANLQTGIPNVLPRASNGIPQTGGARKTRKPRRKH